jgi:hypothetical protein
MASPNYTEELFDKIRSLPDDKIEEVADFVDFLRLRARERQLAVAVAELSEPALLKLWDNPDDAEYDKL